MKKEMKGIYETRIFTKPVVRQCPDCEGEVMRYHDTYQNDGTGLTRVVCKKKCQGWKILDEYDKFE